MIANIYNKYKEGSVYETFYSKILETTVEI